MNNYPAGTSPAYTGFDATNSMNSYFTGVNINIDTSHPTTNFIWPGGTYPAFNGSTNPTFTGGNITTKSNFLHGNPGTHGSTIQDMNFHSVSNAANTGTIVETTRTTRHLPSGECITQETTKYVPNPQFTGAALCASAPRYMLRSNTKKNHAFTSPVITGPTPGNMSSPGVGDDEMVDVPAGWKELINPKGRYYYYNSITGETSNSKPTVKYVTKEAYKAKYHRMPTKRGLMRLHRTLKFIPFFCFVTAVGFTQIELKCAKLVRKALAENS